MGHIGDRSVLKLVLACVVCAALIAAAAAYAMASKRGKAAASEDPSAADLTIPMITVDMAAERIIARTVFATGSLIAREEVLVGAQVEGIRLDTVLVDAGDYVDKGQVLATLDHAVLMARLAQHDAEITKSQAAIAQAKAAIVEAEASEREASPALMRASQLSERGIVSQEKLDQRRSAAAVAVARVDGQQQNLAGLEADKVLGEAKRRETAVNLSRTEVTAPESGLIASKSAKVGQIATLSGEPLFRIIRGGEVELEAEVLDRHLSTLAMGQSAEATIAGFEAGIPGKVRLIGPVVEPSTRLAKVRISLDRTPGLRPGLFARVTIEAGTRRSLVVSRSALQAGPDGYSVKIIENGVVETRKVVTGVSDKNGIEIIAGLAPGDRVVARAASFLRDGDRVNEQAGTTSVGASRVELP